MRRILRPMFLAATFLIVGCNGTNLGPGGQDATSTALHNEIELPHAVDNTQMDLGPRKTSAPLPAFIRKVSPPADGSIPLSTYVSFDDKKYLGVGIPNADSGYDSTVCARIDVELLLQPGDDFSELETVLERVAMEVDGTVLEEVTRYTQNDILGHRINDEGTPWAKYSGPYGFCWHAELKSGSHLARVTFRASNGRVHAYQWYFELTD